EAGSFCRESLAFFPARWKTFLICGNGSSRFPGQGLCGFSGFSRNEADRRRQQRRRVRQRLHLLYPGWKSGGAAVRSGTIGCERESSAGSAESGVRRGQVTGEFFCLGEWRARLSECL